MIVGFDGGGQTAYPDQPVMIALERNSQQVLPAGGGWEWEDPKAFGNWTYCWWKTLLPRWMVLLNWYKPCTTWLRLPRSVRGRSMNFAA